MLAGIANYVRHARLAPARIDFLMTSLAGGRSDIMSVIRWKTCGCCGGLGLHRRDLGQMPEVSYELPDLTIGQIPGGHAGVTDAVADMVEELTIRNRLNGKRTKRGRARILTRADGGFAAPLIGVTGFAFLPIKIMSRCDAGGIVFQWIDAFFGVVGNALMQQPGRDQCLGGRWLFGSGRQSGDKDGVERREEGGNRCDHAKTPNYEFSSHHSCPSGCRTVGSNAGSSGMRDVGFVNC